MARISTYKKDTDITSADLLIGSSYEGEGSNGPIYKTRTYSVGELSAYIGLGEDGDTILSTVNNNSTSITNITTDVSSIKQFLVSLSDTWETLDAQGNITSVSQAFADLILQTTVSDRFASATFAVNLAASVGTYDANGNILTMSESFANLFLNTTASDTLASATYVTNLAASFGTFGNDGTLVSLSQSFIDVVASSVTATGFASASYVTNLAASIGTFDVNGNLTALSEAFANQVFSTTTSTTFAESTYVNNIAASIGTFDASGNLSSYSTSLVNTVATAVSTTGLATTTYVNNIAASVGSFDSNGNLVSYSSSLITAVSNAVATSGFATASDLTTLESTVNGLSSTVTTNSTTIASKPDVFRQTTAPDVTEAVGSIWYDTDDNNRVYILVAGTPNVWTETTDARVQTLVDYAESSYSLTTDANGVITGMELFSVSSPNTTISQVKFTADKFIIKQSTTEATPFVLDGSALKLDVPLNGVSGSFTGQLQVGTGNGQITIDDNGLSVASGSFVINSDGTADFAGNVDVGGLTINGQEITFGDPNNNNSTYPLYWKNNAGTIVAQIQAIALNSAPILQISSDYTVNTTSQNFTQDTTSQVLFRSNGTGTGRTFQAGTQTNPFTYFSAKVENDGIHGINLSVLDVNNNNTTLSSIDIQDDVMSIKPGSTSLNVAPLFISPESASGKLDLAITTNGTSAGEVTIGSATNWFSQFNAYADTMRLDLKGTSGNQLYIAGLSANTYVEGNVSVDDLTVRGTFVNASDATLKENVLPLNKTINVDWKQYNLISKPTETRYGAIAQELEVNHPELIRTIQDQNGNDIKAIAYIDLLIAKVAELEARIAQLENPTA